jgi:pimeloyl-ACP methyl ester carboxylesterase
MINPFEYQQIQSRFSLSLSHQNSRWRRYEVNFPIAFPGIFHNSLTAYGDYYQSASCEKAPLVILVHGWGDHSAIPMQMLARSLAGKGTNAFVLYLPFHSRRLPVEMKPRSPVFTPEEWFNGYRVAVTDVRQVIDWTKIVTKIDCSRIAIIGLSMGAFVGSIAMGIDRRIRAGVFIVSGGNTGKISQLNRIGTFRRRYRTSEQVYAVQQADYALYLEQVVEQGWEHVEPSRQSFLIDPLTFAGQLRFRPVLTINATWDEFIPREAARDFQSACGPCETMWLPLSHSTIWLCYPLIARRIHRFLRSAFETT